MKKTEMPIDEKKLRVKPTLADGLFILFSVLIGVSAFLLLFFARSDGERIEVRYAGELLGEYSLAVDGEHTFLDGAIVVKIEGGEAFVSHSDCPDGSCMLMGRVSAGGESIICLPNRISITVLGGRGEVDIPIS